MRETSTWLNSGAVNDGLITEPSAYITREGFLEAAVQSGLSLEWRSGYCSAQLVRPRQDEGHDRAIVRRIESTLQSVHRAASHSPPNESSRTLLSLIGALAYANYIYYTLLATRPTLQAAGKATTFLELNRPILLGLGFPVPVPNDK